MKSMAPPSMLLGWLIFLSTDKALRGVPWGRLGFGGVRSCSVAKAWKQDSVLAC